MKLSIVTTLYQSSPYINEFYCRATESAKKLVGEDYEIIFVNDGSPDNSLNEVVDLANLDCHILVVDLAKNFGHHKAMMTGLQVSAGNKVFLIDIDLEEQPEWLLNFDQAMNEDQSIDSVYGIQIQRKGGLFEKSTGALFWWLINRLSDLKIPPNIVTARLMSRRYVDALISHRENEIFMAGLWQITGFKQRPFPIIKLNRGKSTYTIKKKILLLINSITSFSTSPLVAIFYLGLFVLAIALFGVSYIFYNAFNNSNSVLGWSSVIVSIWLFGGLTLSSIGIIGIYLSKVFIETKKRPYTIIRKIYGRPQIK